MSKKITAQYKFRECVDDKRGIPIALMHIWKDVETHEDIVVQESWCNIGDVWELWYSDRTGLYYPAKLISRQPLSQRIKLWDDIDKKATRKWHLYYGVNNALLYAHNIRNSKARQQFAYDYISYKMGLSGCPEDPKNVQLYNIREVKMYIDHSFHDYTEDSQHLEKE